MASESDKWATAGRELGIEVIAPFFIEFDGSKHCFAALIGKFGAPNGMVVDSSWEAIAPIEKHLLASGFGFSCVTPPDCGADLEELLADWGQS